jgi:protein SCO1
MAGANYYNRAIVTKRTSEMMSDIPVPHARPSRVSFVILFIVLMLGVALTVLALLQSFSAPAATVPTAQIEGITAITPPDPLPDFTLTDIHNAPISLSDLEGRYVLLFFGFTHCPDFCPLTLADFRQIKTALGDNGESVAFVFITVDGERDTPEVLGRYVTAFDPTFIGMTGSNDQLEALAQPYGLSFTLNKDAPDDDDYSVDHTTLTYIIDPQQRLQAVVSFATPPDVIANYLSAYLATTNTDS